jgi:hypothetical protein
MMAILVNWLVEVVSYFNLTNCCLFLAKALVDRMLASSANMQRDRLQLLGLSALFIAAKFEDSTPVTANKFSVISDDTYSSTEVSILVLTLFHNTSRTLVINHHFCLKLDFGDGKPNFTRIAILRIDSNTTSIFGAVFASCLL